MATRLQQQSRVYQLHYAARDASRMGFRHALTSAFGSAVSLYLDDTNALDLNHLMQAQTSNTMLYLCGPRGMIDAARTAALKAGLGDSAFEVQINSTGQVITVEADQTIIEALECAGVDVMYDCQRGDCGICQCDVIRGVPDHRDVVLSDVERQSGKIMQICVSRAQSARLVLDI